MQSSELKSQKGSTKVSRISLKSDKIKYAFIGNDGSRTSVPSPLQSEHHFEKSNALKMISLVHWLPKLSLKAKKVKDSVPVPDQTLGGHRLSESSRSSDSSSSINGDSDHTVVADIQRYPVDVENQIYELSYKKLCQPKRALGQQVAVSNFMLWHMALVLRTNTSHDPEVFPVISKSEKTLASICAQTRQQCKAVPASKQPDQALNSMLSKYMDSLKKRKRASNMNPREEIAVASTAKNSPKLQRRRSISAPGSTTSDLESSCSDDSVSDAMSRDELEPVSSKSKKPKSKKHTQRHRSLSQDAGAKKSSGKKGTKKLKKHRVKDTFNSSNPLLCNEVSSLLSDDFGSRSPILGSFPESFYEFKPEPLGSDLIVSPDGSSMYSTSESYYPIQSSVGSESHNFHPAYSNGFGFSESPAAYPSAATDATFVNNFRLDDRQFLQALYSSSNFHQRLYESTPSPH